MTKFPAADRLRRLIAAKCCGPKVPATRSEAASRNELATAIEACEPDPDAYAAQAERDAAAMLDGQDEDRERAEAAASMGETAAALRDMARPTRTLPCPGCSGGGDIAADRRRLGNCPVCAQDVSAGVAETTLGVSGAEPPLVVTGPGGDFRTEHRACACCKGPFTAVASATGKYCQECIDRRAKCSATRRHRQGHERGCQVSPEDTIDQRSATQPARTLAATIAAIEQHGMDIPIDSSSRGSGDGVGEHRRSAPAERRPEPCSLDPAGRTDATLLLELARLCAARHDALEAFSRHTPLARPTTNRKAFRHEWKAYLESECNGQKLMMAYIAANNASDAFITANIDRLRQIGGAK